MPTRTSTATNSDLIALNSSDGTLLKQGSSGLGENEVSTAQNSTAHLPTCTCEICSSLLINKEPLAPAPVIGRTVPLSSVPLLSSNSSATAKIFLDFDGHTTSGTFWNTYYNAGNNFTTPAYSLDGDTTTFSTTEIASIEEIWQRVAEDYAPFNVDVTTIDPGNLSAAYNTRVVIGGAYSDWYEESGGAGGVAYLTSWQWSDDTPVFVFEENLGNGFASYTAEASSHEAGHALGLYHQSTYDSSGNKIAEYNPGSGSGETGWAPIMGVSYYQNLTTWHDGPNSQAYNIYQDDMAVIASGSNQVTYRTDDHGNTNGSATALPSNALLNGSGIITTTSDVDVFSFTTGSGTINFTISPEELGPNLDISAELRDSSNTIIATHDPAAQLAASINTSVDEGTYFLHIKSNGSYGRVGQYRFTGTVNPADGNTVSIEATDANAAEAGEDPGTFTITRTGDTSAPLSVDYTVSGSAIAGIDYTPNLSGTATLPAGSSSVNLTITPIDDSKYEGDEPVVLELEPHEDYSLGASTSATVTIAENDGLPYFSNPGFESNDLGGWQTAGVTSTQTLEYGANPPEGTYQALLTNSVGSVSDSALETFLGLSAGSLEGLGNGDATEGSAIKQTVRVKAGDVLTFDWNFLTNEGQDSTYTDFAFVSIQSGNLNTLANTFTPLVASGTDFANETGFETYTYTFPSAGTYTIGVGVMDEEDTNFDSGLLVDDFTLTSSDIVAPTALAFSPEENITGVAGNVNLKITFDEPVQKGTGSILIKKVSDNSTVETIDVTSVNVSVTDKTVTIDPTNNLLGQTGYYVEVAAGTFEDLAGNDFAGITGAANWNFTTGVNTITGTAAANNLVGTAQPDIMNALGGNDTVNGAAGNDTVNAADGDDSLKGGTGDDQLNGGLGNDIFVVDSSADAVLEELNQGTDLVQASVSYILPTHVENLALIGTATNGTGNSLNNTITGNASSNILDGSTGLDIYMGGAGDDIYFINQAGEVVTEAVNAGTDFVNAAVTYTLPVNVENLTLTGVAAINGTGNALGNTITGNSAANTLNGLTGADVLIGKTGNDTYVVENPGDVVIEGASAGTDLVKSSITYTLPANVENLTLTGTVAINGIGNALPNTITGNTGNNILNGSSGNDNLTGSAGVDQLIGGNGNDSLNGGAANDTLTGGLGADQFIYNTNAAFALAAVGLDTISNFAIAQNDKIVLDKTTFTALSSVAGAGFSVPSEFAKVTTDALAATSSADIVYNTATGGLFYNQNGAGAGFGTGGKFATLTGAANLQAAQFVIQA